MMAVCGSTIHARVTIRRSLTPRRAALVARGPQIARPASRGACVVRCMAGSDKDAARKALEQALGGYAKGKDILADNDPTPGTETGGGGGSKGGFFSGWGGGGGDGNDGPSEPLWSKNNLVTLKALGAFCGVIIVFTSWKPMLAVLVNLVFIIFRLDPNPKGASMASGPSGDMSAEEDIIGRWGDDEDDE
eukprot:CAMPEP_0118932428 /NCGR_PEP_ID=MMETSP1169-20130426/10208_1 /TAXON_ID=36882 /ORGANISM="Pyramimonas obovata, Strain CCMP722" /LENGTH=189 /DNA_ID=CAMNT_0006875085 /DNA_START=45 /DNA_END=614 /DNA_ORIENTATION=+